jgi:hypothetical protein
LIAQLRFAGHHFQFYAVLNNFSANILASRNWMLLSAEQGPHQTKLSLAVTAKRSLLTALPQDAVLN